MIPSDDNAVWSLDVEAEATATHVSFDNPENESKGDEFPASQPPTLTAVLEGCLFASHEPLSADRWITLFPQLNEEQLSETMDGLNRLYRRQGRPYCVIRQPKGYRLVIRSRFQPILDRLSGGQKDIRLSPAAIETLSVVAYRQPINRIQVDSLRGQASGHVLRQLERRGLIRVHHQDEQGQSYYTVTPRFLQLFHLRNLADLPRAEDLDRL